MWKIAVFNRLMDLQNYPRNRKSNRVQQPEVLDSKTCSTFPVMACNFFVCMSVELVLPLQNFNMPKVLIEKPAPLHFKLWRQPVGSGPRHWHCTARLRVNCILKAAAGWHQLNPANRGPGLGYQGPGVRCQFRVRSGRRTGRGRSPAPLIRHQETQEHENQVYLHKLSQCTISAWCLVYSRSAAVMHIKSMQKIAGSNLVCTIFELWSRLVHASIC
jgi:hypothetical protein